MSINSSCCVFAFFSVTLLLKFIDTACQPQVKQNDIGIYYGQTDRQSNMFGYKISYMVSTNIDFGY